MDPADLISLFFLDDPLSGNDFAERRYGERSVGGCCAMRRWCWAIADSPALPAFLHGLKDAEPLVRAVCAWALGRFGDPATGQ